MREHGMTSVFSVFADYWCDTFVQLGNKLLLYKYYANTGNTVVVCFLVVVTCSGLHDLLSTQTAVIHLEQWL